MARNIGLKIAFDDVWERVRQATCWEKDNQLATFLKVQPGTISGARQRNSFPIQWAYKIGQEFGCSTDWLMRGEGFRPQGVDFNFPVTRVMVTKNKTPLKNERDDLRLRQPTSSGDEYVHIPRYEVSASAGGGAVIHNEQVADYLSFRAEWVRNTLGVSVRDLALISVIGDSMEPTLSEGDVVLLDMTTRSVLDGSIYALQLNGGLLVKRIQRKLDGSVVVKSDNARYDTETVSEDKADRLKIIGRVVWVGRRL